MNSNDYRLIAEAYMGKQHDGTNMANPEEKREVQIAKEILKYVEAIHTDEGDVDSNAEEIFKLANELLKMHQKKPAQQFGSEQMKQVLDKYNPKPPAQ